MIRSTAPRPILGTKGRRLNTPEALSPIAEWARNTTRHDDVRIVHQPSLGALADVTRNHILSAENVNCVIITSPSADLLTPTAIDRDIPFTKDERFDHILSRETYGADLDLLVSKIPPSDTRTNLSMSLKSLAGEFFAAFDQYDLLQATIEHVSFVPCPRWHVDKVDVRLVCTFLGRGTLLVANQGVRRSPWGTRLTVSNKGFNVDESVAFETSPGEAALMKGESWPGNKGLAVVHRSPDDAGEYGRRLLFKLDGIRHVTDGKSTFVTHYNDLPLSPCGCGQVH